jgi:hypothetical protein
MFNIVSTPKGLRVIQGKSLSSTAGRECLTLIPFLAPSSGEEIKIEWKRLIAVVIKEHNSYINCIMLQRWANNGQRLSSANIKSFRKKFIAFRSNYS